VSGMTAAEKLALLKQLTTTSDTDAVLTAFINQAGQRILNKLYPFQNIDVDRIVESTEMSNGAYALDGQPDVPRNITVTVSAEDTDDTLGIITISGLDINGSSLTEEITPIADRTVDGTSVFSKVYSITGAGWAIDSAEGTNDTIEIGVGDLFDVPKKYHYLQCEIAVFLLNKRGAEGQSRHSENGIDRTYDGGDIPMLKNVVPYAGVIR